MPATNHQTMLISNDFLAGYTLKKFFTNQRPENFLEKAAAHASVMVVTQMFDKFSKSSKKRKRMQGSKSEVEKTATNNLERST